MITGKDHRTYDLSLSLFNEEIQHESWFLELLGEGPSGHFLRRGETSPFISCGNFSLLFSGPVVRSGEGLCDCWCMIG
jgi:hypothetical protein